MQTMMPHIPHGTGYLKLLVNPRSFFMLYAWVDSFTVHIYPKAFYTALRQISVILSFQSWYCIFSHGLWISGVNCKALRRLFCSVFVSS